jgi:esterase/lipase superfamily enzyme
MDKLRSSWYSPRLRRDVTVARFGHYGTPLLLFPTAGGDAEECERMLMIRALSPLIDAGRLKVYSPDSIAGQTWIDRKVDPRHKAWVQNQYDGYVYEELLPHIRRDCRSPDIEVITAGSSLGAFNAAVSVCRHPDAFKAAVCMSGTFDLTGWMDGHHTVDFHMSSPRHFLPYLEDGDQLARLRTRFILMAVGEGRWESPGNSWRMAETLGRKGVPNRVDMWGKDHDHDWPTWREMLPKYMSEMT